MSGVCLGHGPTATVHHSGGWVGKGLRPSLSTSLLVVRTPASSSAIITKRTTTTSLPSLGSSSLHHGLHLPSLSNRAGSRTLTRASPLQHQQHLQQQLSVEDGESGFAAQGTHFERIVNQQELIKDLPGIDARRKQTVKPYTEVPSSIFVSNPEEVDLVGEGLPVIHGDEFPNMYWKALDQIARGQAVQIPKPHPKFTMEDLQRISMQGPQWDDLVLEHAEGVVVDSKQRMLQKYNYIPPSVLGDYRPEVEPDWLALPQASYFDLLQGLRRRNWTSRHYQASAPPWRLQFFTCGYEHVSGWEGWRVVVTEQPGEAGSEARRFWVDLPQAGEVAKVDGKSAPSSVEGLGYNHVFQQLYQAYEQRLPPGVRAQAQAQQFLPPGQVPYHCPADRLLDVSYHLAPDHVTHPVMRWLIRPSLEGVVQGVRWAVDASGYFEVKRAVKSLRHCLLPAWPQPNLYIDPQSTGPLYFLIVLTAGVVIPALRRNRILDIKTLEEDPGAAMEFARSKSTARKEGLTGVEFRDVAGLGPILGEIMEVVEFLKDPKSFAKLGARPPKGILFEGDPGTGKTLMAKALAGEAMVPFYQMSGTEFTEGIVGLGAARVRDLFKRARANSPCVIFVDELDALGLKRAEGDGSGKVNEEREQTLNQLLTEMDGFTPDVGVVFIGATNRGDLLDPALLRPGRFDRRIAMPKPDTEGRFDILKLHLRNKKVSPDVDLMQLARDMPGLVGADLANVVNEAQLSAIRSGREVIQARDMYSGIDRFAQGERRPSLPTRYKLPVLTFAAKEVGIALVAGVLRARHGRIEPVERASIQPKGRSYSRTLFQRGSDEEYHVMTRGRLLDRIKVALAGAVAVRLALGQDTNLAMADIQRATGLARRFVMYYGFSDLGLTTWAMQPYSTDFFPGQTRPRKVVSVDAMDAFAEWCTRSEDFRFDPPHPSDPTWHRYTDEVRRVLKQCYEDVWEVVEEHKEALWAGIRELSAKRELLGGELRDIFDMHPPKKLDHKPQLEMTIFTERGGKWPYGIEWLNDAYPTPYWVKQEQQQEKEQKEKAASGASSGGSNVQSQ